MIRRVIPAMRGLIRGGSRLKTTTRWILRTTIKASGGRHLEAVQQATLAGMDGLKEYLLAERQDQFARAMTHKLTAYALGRHLTFADRADVEELTTQFRMRAIGFATWCIYLFKVAFNSK